MTPVIFLGGLSLIEIDPRSLFRPPSFGFYLLYNEISGDFTHVFDMTHVLSPIFDIFTINPAHSAEQIRPTITISTAGAKSSLFCSSRV